MAPARRELRPSFGRCRAQVICRGNCSRGRQLRRPYLTWIICFGLKPPALTRGSLGSRTSTNLSITTTVVQIVSGTIMIAPMMSATMSRLLRLFIFAPRPDDNRGGIGRSSGVSRFRAGPSGSSASAALAPELSDPAFRRWRFYRQSGCRSSLSTREGLLKSLKLACQRVDLVGQSLVFCLIR
jgi:hypothetical protein